MELKPIIMINKKDLYPKYLYFLFKSNALEKIDADFTYYTSQWFLTFLTYDVPADYVLYFNIIF